MSVFIEALLAAETPVIMELKARDPHGADLLAGRSLAGLAAEYHAAGAPCLSVVTGKWFGGHLGMLREVAACSSLPILQKDFITKEADLVRAKAAGASAVLLTAQLLPSGVLGRLIERALRHGLTPFVEVAGEADLAAVRHGAECVVAVNNKEIRAREAGDADLGRSRALLPGVLATGTRCPVSASGIGTPRAAADLLAAGFAGLLVGTGLLRAATPRDWTAGLKEHLRELKEHLR